MKQEYLGNGAYITVNRDFIGQIIITANHHDEIIATDKVYMDREALLKAIAVYEEDVKSQE